jgi:hypothetical protein
MYLISLIRELYIPRLSISGTYIHDGVQFTVAASSLLDLADAIYSTQQRDAETTKLSLQELIEE